LDISDFPVMLSGFFNGWHTPHTGSRNIRSIIKNKLTGNGVPWIEIGSIEQVSASRGRKNIIKLDDDRELSASVLVSPDNDRFRHPAVIGEPGAIIWENWYGRAASYLETSPTVGVIHTDLGRPAFNDNFIAWHIRPDNEGIFTLSAPLEERYLPLGDDSARFEKVSGLVQPCVIKALGWVFPDLAISPREPGGKICTLPGTTQSVLYTEGNMFGDDIYSQFIKATCLSEKIFNLIK
jgi:hypothetical protein